MRKCVVIAAALLAQPAMASFNGWSHYRTITIDHTKVDSSSAAYTNFTVLVATQSVVYSTQTVGGELANGQDYAFFSDTCTTPLNWDVEKQNLDGSTTAYSWVQIPSLSSSTDTVIYNCWGNSSVISHIGYSTATYDANYGGVWHFSGAPLNSSDSTHNGFTWTTDASYTSTTGQIDGAINTAGTSEIHQTSGIHIPFTAPVTYSGWINLSAVGSDNFSLIFGDEGTHGLYIYQPSAGVYHYYFNTGSGIVDTTHSLSLNTTFMFDVVIDGLGNTIFYVNGSPATFAGVPAANIYYLMGSTVTSELPTGKIDEFRIYADVRSTGLIATEYANQSSPITFYSFGPENSAPVTSTSNALFFGSEM